MNLSDEAMLISNYNTEKGNFGISSIYTAAIGKGTFTLPNAYTPLESSYLEKRFKDGDSIGNISVNMGKGPVAIRNSLKNCAVEKRYLAPAFAIDQNDKNYNITHNLITKTIELKVNSSKADRFIKIHDKQTIIFYDTKIKEFTRICTVKKASLNSLSELILELEEVGSKIPGKNVGFAVIRRYNVNKLDFLTNITLGEMRDLLQYF